MHTADIPHFPFGPNVCAHSLISWQRTRPLPEYPGGQEQVKEPRVLAHRAPCPQSPEGPSRRSHSFTSSQKRNGSPVKPGGHEHR